MLPDTAARTELPPSSFAPSTPTVRSHLAHVLGHRVDAVSKYFSVDPSVVLAAAIAHEIGHLLLPFNAHSKAGLMRPDWNRFDFQ